MLYIHIPFCRQACHYCDFHFSTNLAQQDALVSAICQEIILQKNYLSSPTLQSIYLGGGTPSLLSEKQLAQILDVVYQNFVIQTNVEITLEANPDDLTKDKLNELKNLGINRLSIGIQSFHEPHLQFMNRAHTAHDAHVCVRDAQDVGIDNLSIDLIYAIPAANHSILQSDIQQAIDLGVEHISAYCLTIEPRTVFGNRLKKKQLPPIDEEFAAQQFEILVDTLAKTGFEQYEISNFARNQRYSRHNTNYWRNVPYLGIGPSAHSFDGESRQYNIANNALYIKGINEGKIPFEREILTLADRTNEYLLTGLRTRWGCDVAVLNELLQDDFMSFAKAQINQFVAQDWLIADEKTLMLTSKGKLFADKIAAELFV
jgi:oxygen-independent coproporphyrinogen III oxidase